MNFKPKLSILLLFFFAFLFYSSADNKENSQKYAKPKSALLINQDTTIEEEIESTADEEDEDSVNFEDSFDYYWKLYQQEKEARDSLFFEILKAFDIFGEAFRELLKNYVIELSPLELIKYALDGITSQLDPYTNYFQSGTDFNELVSNKEYVGLGIVVSVVDSSLCVVDFLDSMAKKISGLILGDRIIYVDNVKLPPNLDTLRKYTSGEINSKITLKIQREGIDTLITIVTFRRKIEIPDVSFARELDLDNGKVLYVKIEHFSPRMPDAVNLLLQEFCKDDIRKRKGIILDLRDNPGGVLEAAIQLCEMFLPPGSVIVSTRGRVEDEIKEYKAVMNPSDTTTPLIVLVNRGSASASEVVAGAIQDNDRGVIVGEQTFGKGIIQSVSVLPFDTYLKITTAKYFTPSGRSIHRNRFVSSASRKIGKLYTMDTVFYTRSGRVMKESRGIQPDVEVKSQKESPFLKYLNEKQLVMFFVSYLENTGSLKENLVHDSQKLLTSFVNYLKMKKISYKSEIEIELDSLLNKMEKEKYDKETIRKLKDVRKVVQKPVEFWVQQNNKQILDALRNEIERRVVGFDDYKFLLLKEDIFFKESLKILQNIKEYNKILGKSS